MKKNFTFLLIVLLCSKMFAAYEPYPDDSTLYSYAEVGQNVVYAIYVDDAIKCNDIVLAGSYNEWNCLNCAKFVAIKGFSGWYVACVTDVNEDIQARPVQLSNDSTFTWDYQVGNLSQDNIVRGTATILPGGTDNECQITKIGDKQPILINVTHWKNNPCPSKIYNYTITLVSPDCNPDEYITPAISGDFNNWLQESMILDTVATNARQQQGLPGAVYTATAHTNFGSRYRFRSSEEWGSYWSNVLMEYVDSTGEWKSFNDDKTFAFGNDTIITFDLGNPQKYSWTFCEKVIPNDEMYADFQESFTSDEVWLNDSIGYRDKIYVGARNSINQELHLTFNVNERDSASYIPVGTYTIDNSEQLGTVSASTYGYNYPTGSYATSKSSIWFLRKGTVTISFFGDSLCFTVDAVNSANRRVKSMFKRKIIFNITTSPSDTTYGYTLGDTTVCLYGTAEITAIANKRYRFKNWSKSYSSYTISDNPFRFCVNQDVHYTANFEPNKYTISTYSQHGSIRNGGSYNYNSQVLLTAVPDEFYSFVKWADGCTDNPRIITVTQDTMMVAEFSMNYNGHCGDSLNWSYTGGALVIVGSGPMFDYTEGHMPWKLFKDTISSVSISSGCTKIGAYSFVGIDKLNKIEIPATVSNIGKGAFKDCRYLYNVYSYPSLPPIADPSSFYNYNVYLHATCDNIQYYQLDVVFGSFKYIECIGAVETEITKDTVIVSSTNATIGWEYNAAADTYILTITKDGITFCSLNFNSTGVLLNINFNGAPSRGMADTQTALLTANGWTYTITGLTPGSDYAYTVETKNGSGAIIDSKEGTFRTTGGTPTAIKELENIDSNCFKVIENGQLYIIKDGIKYNVLGSIY